MGLLFGAPMTPTETRAWSDVDGRGRPTLDDVPVSPLRLIPMFAATRLIADQIAAAPLRAYRPGADSARIPLATQPALLRGDLYGWKHRAMTSCLLWGNAYGLVTMRDSGGAPTDIVWLDPSKVEVEDTNGGPVYRLNGSPMPRADLLHVAGYTLPGRTKGMSPVGAFRTTFETGISAQEYARDWYDGGGIPAAVVRNETQTIDEDSAKALKARIKATLRNGDPFVTGKDWTYEQVQAPAADMRFIETMKLTATQIAAIYGVAPEEIGGETGASLTYATLEQNQLKLSIQTVRPWAVRLESAITAMFAGSTYVRFGLDAGVRADVLTRYRAHDLALRLGLETNDEARALEDRPPLTPAQVAEWQQLYAKAAPAAPDAPDMNGANNATE